MKSHHCQKCGARFHSSSATRVFCSRECKIMSQRAEVNPDRVRELYESGLSQSEVAAALCVTQRVIHNVMKRAGIPARKAFKRNQRGEKNSSWKGANACYAAYHSRVAALKGKPQQCEVCGTTDPARAYDWANLTGNYADTDDFKRMCRSCHWKYDEKHRNFKGATGGQPAKSAEGGDNGDV